MVKNLYIIAPRFTAGRRAVARPYYTSFEAGWYS